MKYSFLQSCQLVNKNFQSKKTGWFYWLESMYVVPNKDVRPIPVMFTGLAQYR